MSEPETDPEIDLLGYARGVRLLTDAPGSRHERNAVAAGAAMFGDGRLDGLRVLPCGHLGDPGEPCCIDRPETP